MGAFHIWPLCRCLLIPMLTNEFKIGDLIIEHWEHSKDVDPENIGEHMSAETIDKFIYDLVGCRNVHTVNNCPVIVCKVVTIYHAKIERRTLEIVTAAGDTIEMLNSK